MAPGSFKDLPKRAASDKTLLDKAFSIAKSISVNDYQKGPILMFYNCFDKISSNGAINMKLYQINII